MSAHWIGKKKIEKFSNRFGIEISAGINRSGTKVYDVLCCDDLLTINLHTNEITPCDDRYGLKSSLRKRADWLHSNR